jgi:hypothetical protein
MSNLETSEGRPVETKAWSTSEAIERIADLQGKKVDLVRVAIIPHHLHFGDFGDLSQRPPELREHLERILSREQEANDAMDLAEHYDRYIASIGVPGQTNPRINDKDFSEDIYPDPGLGNIEAIAHNFKMADFLIQFQMRETVKAAIPNYFHPTVPGFFINGTRVEGEGTFLLDLDTSAGSIRSRQELHDFVNIQIPWHRKYDEMGITNRMDAYHLPFEHQAIVSALETSIVG